MGHLVDRTGNTYGSLEVLKRSKNDTRNNAMWLCQCACGTIKVIAGRHLGHGSTKSCGECDLIPHGRYRHGFKVTYIYSAWLSMKTRCYNEKYINYHRYGGRGISVCKKWINSFEAFYKDVGDRPTIVHSIDRIDNDGDYEPDNVK